VRDSELNPSAGERILPASGGSAIAMLPVPEAPRAHAPGRPALFTARLTLLAADMSALCVAMLLALATSSSGAGAELAVAAALLLFTHTRPALPSLRRRLLDTGRDLMVACLLAAMTVFSSQAILGVPTAQPGEILLASALALTSVFTARVALAQWRQRTLRQSGGYPAMIAGAGPLGVAIAGRLLRHPELGLRPIGFFDRNPRGDDHEALGLPLASHGRLSDEVARRGVQHVIVTFQREPDSELLDEVSRCTSAGAQVWMVPRLFELTRDRVALERLGGLPLFCIAPLSPGGWRLSAKYSLDRVLALLGLVLVSPLLLVAGLALLVSLGRPVMLRQKRVGYDGRVFELLKLRTLPVNDTVVSPWRASVAAFVRQTSIDELPQLVNVLRGEMSVVGPRPEQPHLAAEFDRTVYRYSDRLRVKSGITGWAQVHGLGRGPDRFTHVSQSERAEWDNYYIENWSPWLDVKILIATAAAVVRYRQA
jgi:exopolysaccharide biosynthesis polyprenyl glycosylphosphotransferase